MSLKYGLLSLLALLIVLLLAVENIGVWTGSIEVVREKGEARKMEKKPQTTPIPGGQKEPPSIKSYILIAEKNIFSPERKEFSLLTGAGAGGKKPLVRPQVVLYGVTILDNYRAASIVSPGRPLKKGEREMITLKVGESVGEYKITKILSDRITLQAEEDSFDVLLYDASAPKKRIDVKTETKPATVTTTLPGAPPAAQPPAAAAEAPKPAAPREPAATVTPTPAPLPRPVTPAVPPPGFRRGLRPAYPPSSPGTSPPGIPSTESGGN
jgi:hypothetical protein